jgi:IS5 family transposase
LEVATVNSTLSTKGLLLKNGKALDATLIAAPSSTKSGSGKRDPEMRQTMNNNQWHFGVKVHIGVDAKSSRVHSVVGTAANVKDVTQASSLVHSVEKGVFADAGCRGGSKREKTQGIEASWHMAMRPDKRKVLDKATQMGHMLNELEYVKASIRAKVKHPFRVIKRQFGRVKVRYREPMKNTAQLHTPFALSNLWMVRKRIFNMAQGGCARNLADGLRGGSKRLQNAEIHLPKNHADSTLRWSFNIHRLNSRHNGDRADHPQGHLSKTWVQVLAGRSVSTKRLRMESTSSPFVTNDLNTSGAALQNSFSVRGP